MPRQSKFDILCQSYEKKDEINEKTRQIFVDFSVQSRKENGVRKPFFRSNFLIFHTQNCHMYHLKPSDVAFDTLRCGI